MSTIAYFNGDFVPKDQVRISPDDRGFLFGDGIYEVLLSYEGRLYRGADHVERMSNGLAAIGIEGVDVRALISASEEIRARTSTPSIPMAASPFDIRST